MKNLTLAAIAFLGLATSSIVLIVLETLAKPLRWVNVRCLATIAAIHAREIPPGSSS